MNDGWIKLHRKVLKNPIATKAELLGCWASLLLHASHKECSFFVGFKKVALKKGQLVWGEKSFGEKWGFSPSKARRIMFLFKNEELIKVQSTNKYSLITIRKWKTYQVDEEQPEEQVKNKRRTNEEQMKTNKNDKNVKNDKNIILPNGNMVSPKSIETIISSFKDINSSYKSWYKNTTQRNAIKSLLERIGERKVLEAVRVLEKTNAMKYAPIITTPHQLNEKLENLRAFVIRERSEIIKNKTIEV